MFIINRINLGWSCPVTPTKYSIHVSKCKTLPLITFIQHCSLTVMSSSLLVLNSDNERVCGIRQKVTLDLMLNSPFDPKAGTLKALIICTPLCR